MLTKKGAWLSCYLYYEGSADAFLKQEVEPLIQRITADRLIAHFFFIRYNDTYGPHIRLRLQPGEMLTKPESLSPFISSTAPSVRFVRYIPEVERYGGKRGIVIAEELFEASSIAILTLISETAHWTYKSALSSALQLHIGMTNAFGMKQQEAASLFGHIAEQYYDDSKEKFIHLEKNLEPQKALLPQIQTLWKACETQTSFSQPWFTKWQEATQAVGSKLQAAQTRSLLQIPQQEAHKTNHLWYLYESYIHMTNNRLGISHDDESFIAYILQKSLSKA